jgi:hypothetical protein
LRESARNLRVSFWESRKQDKTDEFQWVVERMYRIRDSQDVIDSLLVLLYKSRPQGPKEFFRTSHFVYNQGFEFQPLAEVLIHFDEFCRLSTKGE